MKNYGKIIGYSNYNGNSWDTITGFAKCSCSCLNYYIFNFNGICVKYDKDWNFLTYVYLKPATFTAKCIDDTLYVTSNNYFYTATTDLAIVNQSSKFPVQFRHIYYDEINSLFYLTVDGPSVYVFDMKLNQKSIISLSDSPKNMVSYGIAFFNNKLYVGDNWCRIWLYKLVNGAYQQGSSFKLENCLDQNNRGYAVSLLFDTTGDLIVASSEKKTLTLYDSNGNYKQKKWDLTDNPYTVDVDTEGRLVVVTAKELQIFF